MISRTLVLRRRPTGLVTAQDVVLEERAVPTLQEGSVLIKNRFLSIDPAIRDWMSDHKSYLPPIALGEVVRSTTLGEVVNSCHASFVKGQLAWGLNGWEEYSVVSGDHLVLVPESLDQPQHALSIYGAVGMTAYFALLEVGLPKPGDTVLVSGAAGMVGSLVGQIAKIKGCRVVGIAGSEEKCRWLEELGFDATLNYKSSSDLDAAIADACPEGVDIYFDNVGGEILDAALLNINHRARIVFCGAISTYNAEEPVPGPYNIWQILAKSARMEGFLVRDYFHRFPDGIRHMKEWVDAGDIIFSEHIVNGVEETLTAFNMLFEGTNKGKMLVKLD